MSFDQLPEEVCTIIWDQLDFETVQKTCTLGKFYLLTYYLVRFKILVVLENKNDTYCTYIHAYSYHLLCKRWLGFIRDNAKLSGEMRLILSAINFEISLDIRKNIFQWKKLKNLHVPFVMSAVDLRAYAMLTKVFTSYESPNLLLENLPWIYPST